MKTILIKVSNEGVSYNLEKIIALSQTNIPAPYFRLKETKDIFWQVELVSFNKVDGKLLVRVLDYYPQEVEEFAEQFPKYQIKHIDFEPLHWSELQGFLSSYQKHYLREIITEAPFTKALQKSFTIHVKVALNKLKFELGFASFTKTFKWNKESSTFKIPLPDSIPAYDYIKPYFAKILGKASIDVMIEISSSTSETKVSTINSSDLLKINDETIRILKIQKLEQWSSKKPKYSPQDQNIFTFEEAMESYGDEALGNIDILEKDLLFYLLKKEDVRNKLQLQYLSDRIHAQDENLLMTLVPQFGFVFINKGEEMTHFIWELLNSHATYVWSLPGRNSNKKIKIIEQEIRTINVHGRTVYKSAFAAREGLFFRSIRHKSGTYSYEQYFASWKKNLDNLLV